jgi:hypothetical protein
MDGQAPPDRYPHALVTIRCKRCGKVAGSVFPDGMIDLFERDVRGTERARRMRWKARDAGDARRLPQTGRVQFSSQPLEGAPRTVRVWCDSHGFGDVKSRTLRLALQQSGREGREVRVRVQMQRPVPTQC